MEATLRQDTFSISVPRIDLKRFKGIVKAMGWIITPAPKEDKFDITKTAGFREAMDDVKNGRVTQYASTDDMFKQLGITI